MALVMMQSVGEQSVEDNTPDFNKTFYVEWVC